MVRRILPVFFQWVWALLIIFLPISSMPLVVRLVGSDTVAAPSGLFLVVLVGLWLIPFLLRGGKLPRQSLPFWGFILVAVAATAASIFINIPPFKEVSNLRNNLSALLTLGVGLSFYLVAATFPADDARIQFALRCINWGGLALLLWSFAQAGAWQVYGRYPQWMRVIHDVYSVGPLFRARLSGFALEPSWLAHQLNMLYLPFWLAATINRFSAHRWRIVGIRFETMLLVGGAAVLLLTFSRVGLMAFLVMVGLVLLRLNLWLVRRLQAWLLTRWQPSKIQQARRNRWLAVAILAAFLIIYSSAILGFGLILSKVDPRMADLFKFDFSRPNALESYAENLTFASRMIYWQTGYNIFNAHPLLGVGLGNAGFYFPEYMPAYGWKLMEVRNLFYRSSILMNIKSLWVRLLAETGITGFAFFAGWVYLMFLTARSLVVIKNQMLHTLGWMGLFLLIGLFFEGFSIDSFGLPYIWFSFGLLTAAGGIPANKFGKTDSNKGENGGIR